MSCDCSDCRPSARSEDMTRLGQIMDWSLLRTQSKMPLGGFWTLASLYGEVSTASCNKSTKSAVLTMIRKRLAGSKDGSNV